jgi:hypothetical protein
MSSPKAQAVADLRQQAYLTEFSRSLRKMIDEGYDPAMAEQLAHRDAAGLIREDDAERKGAQIAYQAAIDYGVELGQVETPFIVAEAVQEAVQEATAKQRERTQGAGGRAKGEKSKPVKTWVRDEWVAAKNEALSKGKTITREAFANRILRSGGKWDTTFPGKKKVGKKWLIGKWLKDL